MHGAIHQNIGVAVYTHNMSNSYLSDSIQIKIMWKERKTHGEKN